MNALKAMELIKKFSKCPRCESRNISNGEGGIVVDGDIFRRFCKCGFDITLNGYGEEIKTVKINMEFSKEEIDLLRKYIGCQGWEDTSNIVKKYNLNMKASEIDKTDEAIYKIYQMLGELNED